MNLALSVAQQGQALGEVPVGAVVVLNGEVIAQAHNECFLQPNPAAHAEMLAIQRAAQVLQDRHLTQCDLYVTLEPCPMCAAAIGLARLRRVYFGAYDPKGGGVDHGPRIFQHTSCFHVPEIYGGIQESDCASLLSGFFQTLRDKPEKIPCQKKTS